MLPRRAATHARHDIIINDMDAWRRPRAHAKYSKPSRAWRPGPVLIGWNCISKRASLSGKVRSTWSCTPSRASRCSQRDKTCGGAAKQDGEWEIRSVQALFEAAVADRDPSPLPRKASPSCLYCCWHSRVEPLGSQRRPSGVVGLR